MHYALKMRAQIEHLGQVNAKYYDAIYDSKLRAGLNPGVYFGNRLIGNEEHLKLCDPEVLREIIEKLPCPVIIKEKKGE